MTKGLLIFIIVILTIAIIHFCSLRMMRVSEEKKWKYKKVFWYIYGFLFATSGCVNTFPFEEFKPFTSIELLLGVGIIILTFLGKIETKNPT